MHRFVKQMRKINLKNQMKTIILEKWLTMILNYRQCGHPLITPSNLGVNLTSFKHNEPLSHTHHESLHQIHED
jgi:RNase P subunit RPR2